MERANRKIARWGVALLVPLLCVALPHTSWAQLPAPINGTFFWQFGSATLLNDRANELFTDFSCKRTGTECATNTNGWYAGMGIDIPVWQLPWDHMIMGTINIQLKRFEQPDKTFVTVEGLPSPNAPTDLRQDGGFSILTVMVHPKYRWDTFTESQRILPWVIPFGLTIQGFLNPPESLSILEVGPVFGAGVDFRVTERLVVGIDARYTVGTGQTGIVTDNVTAGGFIGIRF